MSWYDLNLNERLTLTGQGKNIQAYIDGVMIDRLEVSGGSRSYFKLESNGKSYFLKAESNEESRYNQCYKEVQIWKRICFKDYKYFTPLLDCSVSSDKFHDWTLFPYVELKYSFESDISHTLYSKCRKIVHNLCHQYNIGDVERWFSINWFIANDEPLIVDYGIGKSDLC